MKRSFEAIRQILLEIESKDDSYQCEIDNGAPADEIAFDAVTSHSLRYYLPLLMDAGLLTGKTAHTLGDQCFYGLRLTWKGHDFLDDIRNEGVWQKVRATLANEKLQTASFGVVAALAKDIIKRNLGLGQ